ncbi:MAG: glycogen synthase [Chlorobiota bacterium]
MNILLATAEISPIAKSGGMADVTSYLTSEWSDLGHNVISVMPAYKFIDYDKFNIIKTDISFEVPMGFRNETANVYKTTLAGSDAIIYLIGHDEFFDSEYLYGNKLEDDNDDRRFLFFSKAIPELCKVINYKPEIVNCHDYLTAFLIPILKTQYKKDDLFKNVGTVFTIHNLSYQGRFDKYRVLSFTGMKYSEFDVGSWFEHEGKVNFMKTGIMYADKIVTVSPTYSEEIKQAYYSEGLQDAINSRLRDIVGILNGVDYNLWGPEHDIYISKNYTENNLDIKAELKKEYLTKAGIPEKKHHLPLISMITKLKDQKGIDLVAKKIYKLMNSNKFIFAVLGAGEEQYEEMLSETKSNFPNNIIVDFSFDEKQTHILLAATDFLLMPSKYEPCGLTQMYALRYGTVPIVRSTGGLADTIKEYSTEKQRGTGITFPHYNRDEMENAINKALSIYNSDIHYNQIRNNGMAKNYSSLKSAKKYISLFKEVIDEMN